MRRYQQDTSEGDRAQDQVGHLEAKRDEDGRYVVRIPKHVREPIDWLAVLWVAIGTIGLLMPVVGVIRWVIRW